MAYTDEERAFIDKALKLFDSAPESLKLFFVGMSKEGQVMTRYGINMGA